MQYVTSVQFLVQLRSKYAAELVSRIGAQLIAGDWSIGSLPQRSKGGMSSTHLLEQIDRIETLEFVDLLRDDGREVREQQHLREWVLQNYISRQLFAPCLPLNRQSENSLRVNI
jgi:hypothetical protein